MDKDTNEAQNSNNNTMPRYHYNVNIFSRTEITNYITKLLITLIDYTHLTTTPPHPAGLYCSTQAETLQYADLLQN